jgi:hypothetical protein
MLKQTLYVLLLFVIPQRFITLDLVHFILIYKINYAETDVGACCCVKTGLPAQKLFQKNQNKRKRCI